MVLLCLVAGALCVQAVVYSRLSTHRTPARNPDAGDRVAQSAAPPVRAAFSRRLGRPVYKYSVIPGGAYSPEELVQALDSDAVAARHYAVFRRAALRTEPSRFAQPVYLSYRVGDAVYWTRRPVALPPHEPLLTDGANFARARCGNRVAVTPQLPVQAASPAPGVLEEAGAPAPEPAAANRDEPLLAAEVFPGLFQETPWRIAVPMPPEDAWGAMERQPSLPPLNCWDVAPSPDAPPDAAAGRPGCAELEWPHYRRGSLPLGSAPETPPGDPFGAPPSGRPDTPIPEPGTLVLTLVGLGVAVAVHRLGWSKRQAPGLLLSLFDPHSTDRHSGRRRPVLPPGSP